MVEAEQLIALRSGERVTLAAVRAPDAEWAGRIEQMLLHKGDPWNWQNSELLRRDTGAEATFFLLHRGGVPFANVMLMQSGPVGLLGHVWTAPADRGGGASSRLLDELLADFDRRGGRALFLGTEFDSMPWHYYRRRGFEPAEPGSGFMARQAETSARFAATWFGAVADVVVEPLGWPHLVTAVPLLLGDFPGAVRLATTRLFGRRVGDESLLPLLRGPAARPADPRPPSACVLRDRVGPAVVAVGCWQPDPWWPKTAVIDIFCHPAWWHRAGALLAALAPPPEHPALAYADADHAAKHAVLAAAGFRPAGVLPGAVARGPMGPRVDVTVLHRPPDASPP